MSINHIISCYVYVKILNLPSFDIKLHGPLTKTFLAYHELTPYDILGQNFLFHPLMLYIYTDFSIIYLSQSYKPPITQKRNLRMLGMDFTIKECEVG